MRLNPRILAATVLVFVTLMVKGLDDGSSPLMTIGYQGLRAASRAGHSVRTRHRSVQIYSWPATQNFLRGTLGDASSDVAFC